MRRPAATLASLRRVAVLARGVTAARLVHAVRELEHEASLGYRAIVLHADGEARALFVREADEAVALGPLSVLDGREVDGPRLAALERAVRLACADALAVGNAPIGVLAAIAELCQRTGLAFIGAPAGALRLVGDGVALRGVAERAGVPVVPWGEAADVAGVLAVAERLGWPVRVASAADGSAAGSRVEGPANVAAAVAAARRRADATALGRGKILVEAIWGAARRIEVDAVADRHGGCCTVGIRDVVRAAAGHALLVEAPAGLAAATARGARGAAARVLGAMGYEGVATVELLYDPGAGTLGLVGIRPGFDEAHAATEAASGVDVVKLALRAAAGARLSTRSPAVRGHALAVRLAAEDPEQGFAPAPGRVARLRLPAGAGLRVDAGNAEGDVLPPGAAPTLATIAAVGARRPEALARLRRALTRTDVVVDGGATTTPCLRAVLARPEVASGTWDAGWLERLVAIGAHVDRGQAHVALAVAAVEAYEEARALAEAQFFAGAARGRPEVRPEVGHRVELRHDGCRYALLTCCLAADRYTVEVDGRRLSVAVERLDECERRVRVAGSGYRVLAARDALGFRIEVDGATHRIRRDDAGVVVAGAPGIVVSVRVAAGDTVAAGDRLVVLEAMKMETAIAAATAGRVRRVLTAANVHVGIGTPLLEIEPVAVEEGGPAAARRVDFSTVAMPIVPSRRRALAALRALVLGYDVEPSAIDALFASPGAPESDDPAPDVALDVLATWADVAALFRPRRIDADAGEAAPEETLRAYLRTVDAGVASLPATFVAALERALARYGVASLAAGPALRRALYTLYCAHRRGDVALRGVRVILEGLLAAAERRHEEASPPLRAVLDRLTVLVEGQSTAFAELVRQLRHRCIEAPRSEAVRQAAYARVDALLAELARTPAPSVAGDAQVAELVECSQPLVGIFLARFGTADRPLRARMLEVLLRRYYRIRPLVSVELLDEGDCVGVRGTYVLDGRHIAVLMVYTQAAEIPAVLRMLGALVAQVPSSHDVVVDVLVWSDGPLTEDDAAAAELAARLDGAGFARPLRRVVFAIASPASGHAIAGMQHFTFRPLPEGYREERMSRHLHPMMGKRLQLWRLAEFDVERLPSPADVYLFRGVARGQPKDERLFAFAEVRDATLVRDAAGTAVEVPELERMLRQVAAAMREVQAARPVDARLHWNRMLLYVWPPLALTHGELQSVARTLLPVTDGLELEKVVVRARMPVASGGPELHDTIIHLSAPARRGLQIRFAEPADRPIRPLSDYGRNVARMRQRGLVHPYEIVRMITPGRDEVDADFPPGTFVEHDLDATGALVPVDRPPGGNGANVVVGVIRNETPAHPEGMARVILLGDPSRAMGALAEPECRRIIAALALAERMRVPLEWVAISAGAKISKDSGTENMDWIALVLRRLVEFTQRAGEVNVLVVGINVGAQPYWNAEATMLMHTRGILVMVPDGAMVLTGKSALDYSGGVSAEDNQGIGGYDRTMGPNGQAQYWARDVADACRILFRHYEHCYVAPGERFPRRVPTTDPSERDVSAFPHGGPLDFATVGEIFSDATNRGRKRPFDIRRVMLAATDQDRPPLERWAGMRGAEIAVVWDAHLGGRPVCLLGVEAHPLPRLGFVPGDGPEQWTAGTLFPRASKKIARAVNAASGNRPLVVLANLAGFDGSPESMRELQLEYGAEIGRAVVNFAGPIVFCVVSRYHGGAFVVFSRTLNENLEAVALEGAHASVIGGAPAAAVVFAGEVDQRTRADPRVRTLDAALAAASGSERARLSAEREERVAAVHSEVLGVVAAEFDRVHSVQRALEVGSLDRVIAPVMLRPYLIDAVERGIARTLERAPAPVRSGDPDRAPADAIG